MNEIFSTWCHIPKNTLLNGHITLKNFQSLQRIDQRGVRLLYCRFGQGYQNLGEIHAPREEIKICSRNINNPVNKIFFSRGSEISYKFFRTKEEHRGQKEIAKDLQLAYEKNLKLFEETKKKKLIEENEKKVFSQTYILYDKASIVKPTFVSELEQYVNILSQFTIFCEKSNNIQGISQKPTKKFFG